MKQLLTIVSLVLIATSPLDAQWSLEAQGGRIRSALDPASAGFESVVVGARYDRFGSQLRVSAGVPTASDQPLWGALSGTHRFAFRSNGLVGGLDVSGNAFVLHDRVQRTREVTDVFQQRRVVPAPANSGLAGAIQAMPLIGFESAKLQLHLRGGVSYYTAEFAEQQRTRTVKLADAQLTLLPSTSFAIMPAVRHYIADEGNHTFGSITAAFGNGPVSVWGSAGQWLQRDSATLTWAGGVGFRIHDRATLTGGMRHDVFDALYGTPGQDSWSVGLTLRLGETPSRAPVPAVFERGQAIIELPASEAGGAPRIAGDFTSWKPQPMMRAGKSWIYRANLTPGVYNYAFVDASGSWFVPAKYPGRKSDGMGGVVAVLVVR